MNLDKEDPAAIDASHVMANAILRVILYGPAVNKEVRVKALCRYNTSLVAPIITMLKDEPLAIAWATVVLKAIIARHNKKWGNNAKA